jgi:microcystin-dependent protein
MTGPDVGQFIGEIRAVGFDFQPTGWAFCDGRHLPVASNTPLFSLLGTLYGGDGNATFGLPNLEGRIPVGQGKLAGGGIYDMGMQGGASAVTLLQGELPSHNHPLVTDSTNPPDKSTPAGAALVTGPQIYAPFQNAITPMHPGSIGAAGGNFPGPNAPHNNMMPYLGLMFVIALQGVFPARS